MVRAREYVQCEEHGWVEAVCSRCDPSPREPEVGVGSKEAPLLAQQSANPVIQGLAGRLRDLEGVLGGALRRLDALVARLDGDGK